MGSVKDLIIIPKIELIAAQFYSAPTPHEFGQGVWRTSGRFSVGDLKDLIPPVEIAGKAEALAMMTAFYFEHAAEIGIESCYKGMLDPDGNLVPVSRLLERGQTSRHIAMRLANTPESSKPEHVIPFHEAIKKGDLTCYVADAESIFRAGLPLGSSSFKKIFRLAGMADVYETVSTYDDTVAALDEIRAKVAGNKDEFSGLYEYLTELGLKEVPNPGQLLLKPVINFTTKFDIGGDQDITPEQAMERMGAGPEGYAAWRDIVQRSTADQIAFCAERGIVNIDGKEEGVIYQGMPVLTDFACTPDENRLMIEYQRGNITFLIPTNKELQRAMFRAAGIYEAIDKAKERALQKDNVVDTWRNYLFEHTTRDTLDKVAKESCAMMSDAIGLVANKILGKQVFGARPLEQWVDSFIPYASRVQDKAD